MDNWFVPGFDPPHVRNTESHLTDLVDRSILLAVECERKDSVITKLP